MTVTELIAKKSFAPSVKEPTFSYWILGKIYSVFSGGYRISQRGRQLLSWA